MERTVATTNRAKSGRHGVKRRDMEKDLPSDKVDKLCNRLRSQGLWQWDEDWPQDEEDHQNKKTPTKIFPYRLGVFQHIYIYLVSKLLFTGI